jgi:hypothetical protein
MYLQKVKDENSRILIHWSEARIRKEYFVCPQKDSHAVPVHWYITFIRLGRGESLLLYSCNRDILHWPLCEDSDSPLLLIFSISDRNHKTFFSTGGLLSALHYNAETPAGVKCVRPHLSQCSQVRCYILSYESIPKVLQSKDCRE